MTEMLCNNNNKKKKKRDDISNCAHVCVCMYLYIKLLKAKVCTCVWESFPPRCRVYGREEQKKKKKNERQYRVVVVVYCNLISPSFHKPLLRRILSFSSPEKTRRKKYRFVIIKKKKATLCYVFAAIRSAAQYRRLIYCDSSTRETTCIFIRFNEKYIYKDTTEYDLIWFFFFFKVLLVL